MVRFGTELFITAGYSSNGLFCRVMLPRVNRAISRHSPAAAPMAASVGFGNGSGCSAVAVLINASPVELIYAKKGKFSPNANTWQKCKEEIHGGCETKIGFQALKLCNSHRGVQKFGTKLFNKDGSAESFAP